MKFIFAVIAGLFSSCGVIVTSASSTIIQDETDCDCLDEKCDKCDCEFGCECPCEEEVNHEELI